MNRRGFIHATSAAGIVAAGGVLLGTAPRVDLTPTVLRQASGRRVRVAGWLHAGKAFPHHYFTLSADRWVDDPCSADVRDWAQAAIRVYPAPQGLRPGRVELTGRLWYGRSLDLATGHAAGAVMTEAKLA